MIELRWETDIRASAEQVFSLLAELRDYDRWLPRSSAFKGTSNISDGPITAGTTYVESAPLGTRYGKVTGFERPTQLNFEQPMTMKPSALGVLDIRLFHTITPGEAGVHLVRVAQLSTSGPMKFAMPIVVRSVRSETERMLKALKSFAESQS